MIVEYEINSISLGERTLFFKLVIQLNPSITTSQIARYSSEINDDGHKNELIFYRIKAVVST